MNNRIVKKLESQDLPLIYPLRKQIAAYKPKIGFKK
jgi:hypothetical protein